MSEAVTELRPTVGHVPVSSLIFVVIVAIWAAYLVQHWARRREDAAATRSVDGFTEAMRVLEKRPVLPATELSTPRPHSYAVKPAGVGRPTVDVKRAVPAGSGRRPSPLVARRGERVVTASLPSGAHGDRYTDHDIAPYAAEVDRMPESARQTSRGIGSRPGRPASAAGRAPARPSVAQRRIRAALLLVAVAWLPVSIVLTVTGVLMWISIPFAVLTVGAVLVWLRAEAQADRVRAGAGMDESYEPCTGRRRSRARTPRSSGAPRSRPRPRPWRRPTSPRLSSRSVWSVACSTSRRRFPASSRVAVVEAAPVAEGSWSPVPVPRPTYSLKAKAEPRYTETGIPADVFDTPEFAEEAEELDDRALFARRAVSQ